MNVLYTCDNNYIWLMGISVISLFENNKDIHDLTVYLLGEGISEENKKVLHELGEQYERKIKIIDVPYFDIPNSLVSARWPLSAFTRLFSANLLPDEIEKILYLDCDTIINGSISELDKVDVSGKVFLGVKDCIGKKYKENIGLKFNDAYINAGVLLINFKRLRKIDVAEKIDQYLQKFLYLINYADQDILNGTFKNEIGTLNPKYDVMTIEAVYSYNDIKLLRRPVNYYSEIEISEAVKKPIIIHYTTNMRTIRPWFSNSNHPFVEVFRKYLAMSPWKNKKLDDFKFKSRESWLIGLIQILPNKIACSLLGLIHAEIKPNVIRWRTINGK